MKVFPGGGAQAVCSSMDDTLELLTVRYKAAHDEYQAIVDKNSELTLTGGKSAPEDLLDEERAFEQLDAARHALLTAVAGGEPTIH